MDKITEYQYRKRLKELQLEVNKLQGYRAWMLEIYDCAITTAGKNENVSGEWILKKFRWLLK